MERNNEIGMEGNPMTEEKTTFTKEEVLSIINRANEIINNLQNDKGVEITKNQLEFYFKIVENSIVFDSAIVDKAVKAIDYILFRNINFDDNNTEKINTEE